MSSLVPTTSVTDTDIDLATLAYAVARNDVGEKIPLRDLLLREGIDPTDRRLPHLLRSDLFKGRHQAYLQELKNSGESFKLKARVQAEELLKTAWEIVQDKNAPHSVRMKGIENVVEWADLKPKKDAGTTTSTPAITINIDLGGDTPEVIDVTPAAPAIGHDAV